MEDFKASMNEEEEKQVKDWQLEGQTVMFLALKNKIEGIVGVSDRIKQTSAKAIHSLQKMGVQVIMMTGDNKLTAKAVAGELNLDGFVADCLPDDKYNKIKELQKQGHVVAMAGDGINGVPIAAGALFPLFGILLSPMIAAAAMSFSSVTVISNALRLKKR
jgi:P-type E1-E2 ATPase